MRKSLISLALLLGSISQAHAQETVLWKNMDPWSVRVDRTLNYGCFLFIVGTRGTLIRIGFNKSSGENYIMVGHNSWQSIEVGKQYPMTVQFDSETPWTGNALGMRLGNFPNLYMRFSDVKLATQFAERHQIAIWYGQKLITQFSLKGSYAAIVEMATCQQSIDANRSNAPSQQSPDPFGSSRSQQPISDPFK